MRPSPALPTGESGAGKAGQPGWFFADERFLPTGAGIRAGEVLESLDTEGSWDQPRARLTVLFCAFLI
jgi:hypothetical protein